MDRYCPKCSKEYPGDLKVCPVDGATLVQPGDRDLTGEELDGRYRVKRVLGRGGMGVVYIAEQTMIGRLVGLKVLRRDMVQDTASIKRFQTEAKAIARLRNPHTITLYDFGVTSDGLLYYTMELLDGSPLSDVLRDDGPMPVDRAAEIIFQTLESLEEAHDQEILHRDLKPDNLYVSRHKGKDHVTVLDFGIAKLVGDQSMETITRTGMICGTPQYLAPEQALGNPAVPASDLYSLGIVFYEMLAGMPPFQETTPMKVLLKHLNEQPVPVRVKNPQVEVPVAIEGFLQRALEKTPEARFGNVREFRKALRSALAHRLDHPETVKLSPIATTSDGVRSITQPLGPDQETPTEESFKGTPVRPAEDLRDTVRDEDEVRDDSTRVAPAVAESIDPLGDTMMTPAPEATRLQVPTPQPVTVEDTRGPSVESEPSRSRLPWVAGASVVVLAAVLALWRPWASTDAEPPAPTEQAAAQTAEETAPEPANPASQAPAAIAEDVVEQAAVPIEEVRTAEVLSAGSGNDDIISPDVRVATGPALPDDDIRAGEVVSPGVQVATNPSSPDADIRTTDVALATSRSHTEEVRTAEEAPAEHVAVHGGGPAAKEEERTSKKAAPAKKAVAVKKASPAPAQPEEKKEEPAPKKSLGFRSLQEKAPAKEPVASPPKETPPPPVEPEEPKKKGLGFRPLGSEG